MFAAAGAGLFAYLVHQSGVTLATLEHISTQRLCALLGMSSTVVAFDVLAWWAAIGGAASMAKLLALRLAGDALTNGLPGGVVLGESYKLLMLRRWCGVSVSDAAASQIIVKFGLGLSQSLYVLGGLALCYPLLRQRSAELLGFEGAQVIGIIAIVVMAALLLVPLSLLATGRSFGALTRAIARLPIARLRAFIERKREGIDALDSSMKSALRRPRRMVAVLVLLLAGWMATSGESYVLLGGLGLAVTPLRAYVVDSVGSMFRLIFFVVPSGLGGQDASLLLLMRLYGYPKPAGGAFVVLRRLKELLFIAVGLLLLAVFRPQRARADAEPPPP